MTASSHPDHSEERREAIVRAALALLGEGGLDRMSLRRLAAHLGMHAPGLYWYIENKQQLMDLMAQRILADGLAGLQPLQPAQTWDHWLVEMACALRRALLAHRDGARVVAGAYNMRTGALNPMTEQALEILEGAGFDRVVALGVTLMLFRYALGMALDEQASPLGGPPDPDFAEKMANIPPPPIDVERFPRTADAMRQAFERRLRDRDLMFRWGARMIVSGLAMSRPT